jgi:hypothetical protein
MTVEQFRRFRDARTFDPFVIHLADGRSFGVVHPEAVALSVSGRTASIVNNDEMLEVIDLLLVVSLRPMTEMERRAHRIRR